MKSAIEKKTILSFLAAFVVLYILVTSADISSTFEIMRSVDIGVYLFAFSTMFFSYLLRVLRWKKLLENVGFVGRLKDITEILTLSYFVNTIAPAKLGDVYRGYLMKKNYKEPISRILGTVFVERSFDIIAMVLLFSSVVFLVFKQIPQNIMLSMKVGVVLSVLVIVFMVIMKYHDEWLLRFVPKRAGDIFVTFKKGTSDALVGSSMPLIGTYTAFIWILDGCRMFLVMRAVGLDAPFSLAVFVVLAGGLATAFPLTPAGLGAVELTVSGLLILFGVDKGLAVSITLLDRFISYWAFLIIGGLVYVLSKKK
ncbi:MAG: lysylphosphatidylglycerol synthase transmembrane domain-containing protein [Candidatus Hydrothermarchaeaceae archaeon]